MLKSIFLVEELNHQIASAKFDKFSELYFFNPHEVELISKERVNVVIHESITFWELERELEYLQKHYLIV